MSIDKWVQPRAQGAVPLLEGEVKRPEETMVTPRVGHDIFLTVSNWLEKCARGGKYYLHRPAPSSILEPISVTTDLK